MTSTSSSVGDELERLLQVELAVGGQADGLVRGRGPHVGELLLLRDVDVHVVGAGVLADDHALVDRRAGADEQLAPVLHVGEGVGRRVAGAVGHEDAGLAARDLALPLHPALEQGVHDRGAAGVGQELGADADEAAGGDLELEAHAPRAVVHHLRHLALAQRHLLEHDAHVGLGQVDVEELERLLAHAVLVVGDDLRVRDAELEALAAHRLDEDRELQLAAAEDLEGVRGVGGLDPDRDVREQLLLEPVLDVARGDPAALAAGEGRGVDREDHRDASARRCAAAGSGAGSSAEVTVSPIWMPSKPARATISPQAASSASMRFRPSKT